MGRATELGRQPLCSVPGVESLGSQDWSAPGKATEKLMEETHDGWLLLFPAGVWHSCYQEHFNWLANCMVTRKVSLGNWLCCLFRHLGVNVETELKRNVKTLVVTRVSMLLLFFSFMCMWDILHKSWSFALTGNKATVESVGLITRSLSS